MGENTFVAEFEAQWDRDRIWLGSPWHVSKNAVVLAEFEDYMRPDELIAQQIDKEATSIQFDHVGVFLRARCPRDEKDELSFGPKLRAPEEKKKTASGDSSNKEQFSGPSSQRESKNSSNVGQEGVEVNSPVKNRTSSNKRKEAPKQVYRRVDPAPFLLTDGKTTNGSANVDPQETVSDSVREGDEQVEERVPKKKKPTPAGTAGGLGTPRQFESFAGCFTVDSIGLSGGIGLYWSKDVDFVLKNYSKNHIDVLVRVKDQAAPDWRFTAFYGAPRVEDRHHSWRFLWTLHALPHSSWLCMGKFNETMFGDRHFSKSARPEWQMKAFREAIEDVSFQDLGWSGMAYMWDNRDTWHEEDGLRTRAPGFQGIVESLGALQKELEPWGAKELGCLARTVRQLQKKLDKLRRQSIGRGPSDEEKATVIKLREAVRQEEVWLWQRSRFLWLRACDRNTGYFHTQAKQRQRMNKISGLKRVDGSVCAHEGEDKQEIHAFYQALYTSQGVFDTSELLAHVPVKVTPEMNEMLTKPFEAQEVHDALFQMAPSKAPGVDGFTTGFFQRHWHFLKDDVNNAVLGFLNGVNYRRLNGELQPYFTPSRGLRQDSQCAERLNDILRIYDEALGQRVNKDKSAIFFSPNMPCFIRQIIKGTMGIMVEAFSDRYLGLPTAVGRITSGTFDHIGERAQSKMQGWSERLFACAGREVRELIDSENWTWKQDQVRHNFIAPDAEAILNIPLRRGGGKDTLAWAHERSDIYTVKSAYRAPVIQKEHQAREEGQVTESSVSKHQLWKSLWSLKVVPKVRVFWWRVLRGILPDECTLKFQHIQDISLCKLCKAKNEDLEHALIHCSHSQRFWEEARQLLDIKLPRLHPSTWATDILCDARFSTRERASMISMMWSIWTSRNQWTHEGDKLDPANSVRLTREALALLDIPLQHVNTLPGHSWRPPEAAQIKINTDASTIRDEGKSGARGVARSSTAILGVWCKPHPGVTGPFIAEALAVRDGVIFASLRGLSHVVLETDSLEVVNLWNTRRNSRSVVAPILQEIDELFTSFNSFVIQDISRSVNVPAHLCAKHACTMAVTESWLTETPSFLISSLVADCPANAFI
ncbi:uncharacterized protein [Aegilops tauschii subsp. strangulata]|uniref:uncharacterized protein n=1 Tax=Aegilops tauschii subsp. strangulata TaxID=200361 RepID=UPI003CC841A4